MSIRSLIESGTRHSAELLRGPDRRRQFNFIANRVALLGQWTDHVPHPTRISLDPVNVCNLKCPFCSTGNGTTQMKKARLTPELFERIWANVRPGLFKEAHLYNWGEPFLNPHTTDFLRRFADAGVETWISSNLSVKDYDDAFAERLVESGLARMIISADGISQEVYERYRVGGSVERVMKNVKLIADAKKRLGSKTPIMQWRVLLNRFNQGEIAEAGRKAVELGAHFQVTPVFQVPEELREEWHADMTKAIFGEGGVVASWGLNTGPLIHTECRQLWDQIIVNSDGDVMPCCVTADQKAAIGNLAEEDIMSIWNGEMIRKLRRFVTRPGESAPDFHNSCEDCTQRYCTWSPEGLPKTSNGTGKH